MIKDSGKFIQIYCFTQWASSGWVIAPRPLLLIHCFAFSSNRPIVPFSQSKRLFIAASHSPCPSKDLLKPTHFALVDISNLFSTIHIV